ncbi:MAG: hypothetical protein GQ540_06330 [Lutibacter sp.]|uniref:Calx-beta domain-containing protein n=1 Tax=Lutibacter sp. TaxID=1925666 RepID=UPI0019E43755|nr:Calx-beta domain-containing protein [Lutibacter sp.]NOR28129.1 hypothetical protein [Lutibacter sp.]
MKKIFKSLIYITVLAFFVSACDENDTTFDSLSFPEDAFIAMENANDIVVLESTTTPIEIVVNYANTLENATTDVTVDFTITSDTATEGVHYTIEGNSSQLTFAAGQLNAKIVIIPIDNSEEDGDKVLTFTLTNSSVSIGLPGPDSFNKSVTVTLTDDDCAFTFAGLDGISWIGTDNATGSQGPNPTQIVTSFDGTDLLMDGLAYGWLASTYWNEVVVASAPVIVDMDPITGVFTISEQYLADTTWLGNPQPTYYISASGQYFSCLNKMIVNYTLIQNGGVLREYTETIEF